jgi:hypothetical protein
MTKITNSIQSYKSCRKYKSGNGHTRTSEYIRGGIRCHGGISIPCRPVTYAVNLVSRWGKRYELTVVEISVSRTVNNWYETYQRTCGPTKGCMSKYHSNDHKLCGKLPANETVKTLKKKINLFVSRMPRTINWSYVEQTLAYRISCDIYIYIYTRYTTFVLVKGCICKWYFNEHKICEMLLWKSYIINYFMAHFL